ncbi:uncharacterized protein LOC127142649 isoform X2 [Lates calcarifer]|uniref:Uncharacterized protein LOC127142649 isoform X2 n=1 Tax=Lates calcarifer TaxID=8187 RepID=A0AAJ8B9N0_LATCA|nr:uncharacterized protein LOC127142649 isoform X2 [Lates calcarifer]
MHRSKANYIRLRDTSMAQTTSMKNFYVHLAGKTNDAHHDFVRKLKSYGFTQVSSHDHCDYCVVFCPIASRVGTDVAEALERSPAGKPIILVVMHHTFDRDHVVAESRRLVDNQDVTVTVDYLFYEKNLLQCKRNDISWGEIEKTLGIPRVRSRLTDLIQQLSHQRWIWIGLLFGLGILVILAVIVFNLLKKH